MTRIQAYNTQLNDVRAKAKLALGQLGMNGLAENFYEDNTNPQSMRLAAALLNEAAAQMDVANLIQANIQYDKN